MNLIEVVKKCQNGVLDNGMLIEYSLFFDEIARGCCKFSIDNNKELNILKEIFLKIRQMDEYAEIYVSTYGINLAKNNISIYADTVLIHSIISIEELYYFFKEYPKIEPSDIELLIDDEIIDEVAEVVVLKEYGLENYKSFIQKRQLNIIKSLYWD